ncbi:MAG TPA: vWA domain-containing protein [Pirellulales bacterium]|nr:vWA domain-containing protein [Pirellulales bacterium]
MSEQAHAEGGSGIGPSLPTPDGPSLVHAAPQEPKAPAAASKKEPVAKPLPAESRAAAAATSAVVPLTPAASSEKRDRGRRRWLSAVRMRFGTGVCCSAILHLALVILLGMWFLPELVKPHFAELEAAVFERPDELLNQVLETDVDPTKELALVSSSPEAATAGGGEITGVSQPTFDRTVAENSTMPGVTVGDPLRFGSMQSSLDLDLPDGTFGEPQAIVDNYQEAMDRITYEILNMLSKGKVLVIWCFDQSESMKDDQQEIRDRIDRVYAELGLSAVADGDALMGAVTSYGGEFKIHTPKPTANVEEVRAAIGEVPIDKSGKEMMCNAVQYSISAFHKYATSGRRQLALILVTDESGEEEDNFQNLEAAVKEARETRCAVYVLGREAVFGYPYAHMRWIDPQTKIPFWLQINRGPETPLPEQLQIDGFTRRWDAHPSGFGPYEQVRLARETGGVFFMLPSPEVNLVARDDRKYELERMRPYLPDLGSRADYLKRRDKSKLRGTLWQVIMDLNPYNTQSSKYCTVQVTFPIDRQAFAEAAATNVQTGRGMHDYLMQAEKMLDKVRPLRDREQSFRWQANFDLMYAQVIAYQIRIQEYAAYLPDFVKHPKEIKNPLGKDMATTHWDIRTRAEIMTGEKTKVAVERATGLLKDVVDKHPGTPYAARAEWELRRGFGVELIEAFYDPRRGSIKVPNL